MDFPNDNCILKFNPCFNFQRHQTNVVHNGDVVSVASYKQVCSRSPHLFASYHGKFYENTESLKKFELYENEVHSTQVLGSVDQATFWRIQIYSGDERSEENLKVGDVI